MLSYSTLGSCFVNNIPIFHHVLGTVSQVISNCNINVPYSELQYCELLENSEL